MLKPPYHYRPLPLLLVLLSACGGGGEAGDASAPVSLQAPVTAGNIASNPPPATPPTAVAPAPSAEQRPAPTEPSAAPLVMAGAGPVDTPGSTPPAPEAPPPAMSAAAGNASPPAATPPISIAPPAAPTSGATAIDTPITAPTSGSASSGSANTRPATGTSATTPTSGTAATGTTTRPTSGSTATGTTTTTRPATGTTTTTPTSGTSTPRPTAGTGATATSAPSSGSTATSTTAPPAISTPTATAPSPGEDPWKFQPTAGCELTYTEKRPNPKAGPDPRVGEQWFLSNPGGRPPGPFRNMVFAPDMTRGIDVNAGPVWSAGYKGEGIRIAIIDDAVELTHDDMIENLVPGASFNFIGYEPNPARKHGPGYGNAWPMPCKNSDRHGTSVAGIIVARDNNATGGQGVAPRAGLIGLNLLKSTYEANYIRAFTWQPDSTHIYNSSWGSADGGQFHPVTTRATSLAMRKQLETGRQQRGAIYVFSGGNGGAIGDYSPYDARISELGTLAVCAVNAGGKRAAFSEPGPNLLVCGPSGDMGTSFDIMRPGILTPTIKNGYDDLFSGTSAAAPMVSGVTALLLQARPELTWRDVRLVLARSARKVDERNPGWTSYNGLNYNHELGFGLVDAEKAVNIARTWTSVGGSSTLKQCGPFTLPEAQRKRPVPEVALMSANRLDMRDTEAFMGNPQKAWEDIDFNRPVTGGDRTTITIPASCDIRRIEHVDVNLTATPATTGYAQHDLQISLTSPAGQTSTLTLPHQCYKSVAGTNGGDPTREATPCGVLNDFRFGLARHMDEPAIHNGNGRWTLTTADRVAGERYTLDTWSITLYGR